jgi:hypothetical protein
MSVNPDKLNEFLGRGVVDFGAVFHAAMVLIGDKLGLCKKLAELGPMNSAELAKTTGTAERYVRETLKPNGTWMIVEPFAGDRLEDNLNAVGRSFYSASTLICTPASLAQEVGTALGAQAGEARLREIVLGGGSTGFRRATETPFNLILEAKP